MLCRLSMVFSLIWLMTSSSAMAQHRISFATNGTNYREGFERVVESYEELHPDVDVQLTFVSLNYETWVRTQFAGGEGLAPDIYNGNVTYDYGLLGRWVALNDYLDEVNPYTGKPWRETLDMNLMDRAKMAGQFYTVPLDMIEIGIFYNRDLFAENGYEVPETWEEMIALGEQMQEDGYVPFAVPGSLREVWIAQVGWITRMLGDAYYRDLVPLVTPKPGDWDYDPNRTGQFEQDFSDPYDDLLADINQERVHQAILDGTIDFRDERSRGIYTRLKEWSELWQPGFMGADGSTAHRLFLTQTAAMELHHSGNVTWMIKEMEDLPEEDRFDWGVFPVPPIKNDPLVKGDIRGIGGMGTVLTITKKSDPEHVKRVIDFMMYLTSPESMQIIVNEALENRRPLTGPPAIKGVELSPELDARYEPFYGHGYERLNFRGLDDEQESVYEWTVLLQDYLGDRMTLDEFLNEYQDVMMRAHARIKERLNLDMDPTTNDRERMVASREDTLQERGPTLMNGTVVASCMLGVFALMLGCLCVQNPAGLARVNALKAYGLLLPTFLLIIAFLYYPALSGLLSGFTRWEEGGTPHFNGLENFQKMSDDIFLRVGIWNQIVLLVTGLFKATVVPLIIAELVFYLRSSRLQYIFRTAFLVPIVIPAMVTLLIWRFIYAPHLGLLNSSLSAFGLEELRTAWLGDPRFALPSIIMMGFPWVGAFGFLIYLAGLMNIPTAVLDSAKMDCMNTLSRIWHIDVPMMAGQTRLLVVLTMIGSLQDFQTILILTEGGPGTSTMIPALRMFHAAFRFNHFGYGAGIGFLLFLLIMGLTVLSYRMIRTEVA